MTWAFAMHISGRRSPSVLPMRCNGREPLDVTCVVVSAVDDRFVARNLASPAATLTAAAAEALAPFAVGPSRHVALPQENGR